MALGDNAEETAANITCATFLLGLGLFISGVGIWAIAEFFQRMGDTQPLWNRGSLSRMISHVSLLALGVPSIALGLRMLRVKSAG